jgi:aminoglycoside phosphotransferase family enzyme
MARLHARFWGHKKSPPVEWLLHPSHDYGGLMLNGFLLTIKLGMASLSRVYPEAYKPIKAWMPILQRRHKYILGELFRPPLTVCHGDAHIENVFYDSRFAGGCAFIDFGNMMFSQSMYDVAFFMCHSLEVDVRRSTEEQVVR